MTLEPIFRQDALDYYRGGGAGLGDPILIPPTWMRWTYALCATTSAIVLAAATLVAVPEYVEGPAVIRAEGAQPIVAPLPGIVAAVAMTPRRYVRAGDVLVAFRAEEEVAQLKSVEAELTTTLVRLFADPSDRSVRQAMGSLRSQRDLLRSRVAARTIRADADGIIGDVRVRAGQAVNAGDILMSLAGRSALFTVTAALPGHRRPSLHDGQQMQMRLSEYGDVVEQLNIAHVDDLVVASAEARRSVGIDTTDSAQVSGPSVLVHANLSSGSFVADDRVYDFFDGMRVTVRVQVGAKPLIGIGRKRVYSSR